MEVRQRRPHPRLAGRRQGADKAPAEKEKGGKAPKAKANTGPEALALREENSTAYKDGVMTMIPLDRLRAIDFDGEKEKVTVRVAVSEKPEEDLRLTGSTEYKGINKLAIDAEIDKGELGLAEVHFSGGSPKGIKGVRFPPPKLAAGAKDARPAALTYGDRKGKYVVNLTDLQGLYRTADGEVLSGLLFFKKTIKIDVSKLKKIAAHADEGTLEEPVWGVTLKSGGDEESLTLMSTVQLDGRAPNSRGCSVERRPATGCSPFTWCRRSSSTRRRTRARRNRRTETSERILPLAASPVKPQAAGHTRPNCLSKSRRLNSSAVGRPWGQWCGSSARCRCSTRAAICSGVKRSPARTAEWHAIRLIRPFRRAARVGGWSWFIR